MWPRPVMSSSSLFVQTSYDTVTIYPHVYTVNTLGKSPELPSVVITASCKHILGWVQSNAVRLSIIKGRVHINVAIGSKYCTYQLAA